MEIKTDKNGCTLVIALEGRLDTATSPQLESELNSALDGVTELRFDFSALEYISSAGLRILLSTHKKMTAAGGVMSISGTNAIVREVFDMTGFSDIFTMI